MCSWGVDVLHKANNVQIKSRMVASARACKEREGAGSVEYEALLC
jgi:hypothetical protein